MFPQAVPSQSANSASSIAPSKSGTGLTRWAKLPKRNVFDVTGTGLTAGFPLRAMIASSPASAARMSFDTDEFSAYRRMEKYRHEAVQHGVSEFLRARFTRTVVENAWSLLKRAYNGTYHKMSPKHLHRYITTFTGTSRSSRAGTTTVSFTLSSRWSAWSAGLIGKRIQYKELVA